MKQKKGNLGEARYFFDYVLADSTSRLLKTYMEPEHVFLCFSWKYI